MNRLRGKTFNLLLCFMLIASLLPSEGVIASEDKQYFEDFGGYTDGFAFATNAGEWRKNTTPADWSITEDDGNKAVKLTDAFTDSATFLHHHDSDWRDFTYTAKVKVDNNSRVGIVGRFLNGNNYYLLSLSGGNKLELRQKSSATGTGVKNIAVADFNYSLGQYYTLTLKIEGDQLTGSVEGGPSIQAVDTSLDGPGKIGFYSVGNTNVSFDDVDVTEVFEEENNEPDPGDKDEEEEAGIPNRLDVVGISASGHDGNFPENVLDDNLSTRWSAQSTFVDEKVEGQWLQFDLGTKKKISYVGLAFHNGHSRSAIFDIEVSDDAENWRNVYSGQASGETLGLQAFDFEDVEAKYVKYIGYGNTNANYWNSVTVAHVYGPSSNGQPVLAELIPPPEEEKGDMTPYTVPGLYDADGTPHDIHTPNAVTGKTLNVIEFGAVPNDGLDDVHAILKALEAAESGDAVYFPNGTYDLIGTIANDGTAHIPLKSGVNIVGESEEGTIFLSHFDRNTSNSKVMRGYAENNIVISDLTITSTFDGEYSTDHSVNNPERSGPEFGIYIDEGLGQPSYNITIENVTIEKFQKIGIRISKSKDVVVRNSTFQNMTDVGGGGAGYGIAIQGVAKVDRLGYANDTRHNLVENSTFKGPYMRHGVIIQYFAHNNEIRNNYFEFSKLDAIDLHGENEYLNKIHHNEITGVLTGAGIALGNTGGTAPSNHSASGPFNHIYKNEISNSREGIKVHMGSPDTLIEENTISNITEPGNSRGILIQNGPRTIIKNNIITNNTASNFWGILLEFDPGDTNAGQIGTGIPEDVQILGNTITGNANGIKIDAGVRTILRENNVSGNTGKNFEDNTVTEPEVQEEVINPSDDAKIDIERPDENYGKEDPEKTAATASDRNWYRLYNVKSNHEANTGRIAYFKFPVSEAEKATNALFELYARTGSNTSEVKLDVYGLTDDSWDETTITWNRSPNHASDALEVTGIDETAFLLGSITIEGGTDAKYSVDVTEFVKQQTDGFVTFMLVDTLGQNGNVSILSKEDPNSAKWPVLKVSKAEEESPYPLEIVTTSFTDLYGNPVTTLTDNGFMKVNAKVANVSKEKISGTLIVALYKPNHSISRIAFADQSINSGDIQSFGAGFDLPDDVSGYYMKVFVWDSLEGMKPLADAVQF